eukprot:12426898-Heterocapsa_arctica.AAC.1
MDNAMERLRDRCRVTSQRSSGLLRRRKDCQSESVEAIGLDLALGPSMTKRDEKNTTGKLSLKNTEKGTGQNATRWFQKRGRLVDRRDVDVTRGRSDVLRAGRLPYDRF